MNMTKPTKTLFSAVTLCIVIAFTSVASITSVNASDNNMYFDTPRDHQKHQHQGNKHKMKRMTKALSLSEEQQVQIKAIKMQDKEQSQTLRASIKQFKIAEKKLLQTEAFDEQKFSALYDEYQPFFAQLALIRMKNQYAIFTVLTAEKQVKWLKIIEHHKGSHKGKDKKVCG